MALYLNTETGGVHEVSDQRTLDIILSCKTLQGAPVFVEVEPVQEVEAPAEETPTGNEVPKGGETPVGDVIPPATETPKEDAAPKPDETPRAAGK